MLLNTSDNLAFNTAYDSFDAINYPHIIEHLSLTIRLKSA